MSKEKNNKKTVKKVTSKVKETTVNEPIEKVNLEEVLSVKEDNENIVLNTENLETKSVDNNINEDEPKLINQVEIHEEKKETNKINNKKMSDRIDRTFGYLWNGQEMDY